MPHRHPPRKVRPECSVGSRQWGQVINTAVTSSSPGESRVLRWLLGALPEPGRCGRVAACVPTGSAHPQLSQRCRLPARQLLTPFHPVEQNTGPRVETGLKLDSQPKPKCLSKFRRRQQCPQAESGLPSKNVWGPLGMHRCRLCLCFGHAALTGWPGGRWVRVGDSEVWDAGTSAVFSSQVSDCRR